MQVACVYPLPVQPLSDVEKMKIELSKIKKLMKEVDEGQAVGTTYDNLKNAIFVTNELVQSLDNANDFFKIGGFPLLGPLLEYSEARVVAAVAELIADLCQNNRYCQERAVECELLPKLVHLMRQHEDPSVCLKALYAVSCLCRHCSTALRQLETSNTIPVLLEMLQRPDERLKAKAAFFLTYLSLCRKFSDALHEAGYTKLLVKLLGKEEASACEHLLSALLAQITENKKSLLECQRQSCLKDILESKCKFYDTKEEFKEAKEYCQQILDTCTIGE